MRRCASVLSLFVLGLSSILPPSAYSQTGSLYGTLHDAESGEELLGANVLIVGTTIGAVTDVEGKYLIRNVPPGTYHVRFSYVGYAAKMVEGVEVKPGGAVKLDVNLSVETVNQEEVVVTAERLISTEAAVLADRKRSGAIGDGISAEQVRRTPDATSGDALKRVTGLSIVDNKFLFIRGVTDRYNATTLDGASVASTEAGRKSFSFDLLPAGLLENTTVVKSATPEMPGDFTGGLVQMSTLEFPDRGVLKLSLSTSHNSMTSGREVGRSSGGGTDWLGRDDGGRAFPGDKSDGTQFAQSLPNTWAPSRRRAPLPLGLTLSGGDRVVFGADDAPQSQLGFIAALTYRSGLQRNERTINDIDQDRYSTGTRDDYSVLWGALANVSYKFSGTDKISFKNSFNQSAEDQITLFRQDDRSNTLENRVTMQSWSQRSIYTAHVQGTHAFPGFAALSLDWRLGLSSSARRDPDRKEVVYYRPLDDPTLPFTVGYNKRSWARLDDRTLSGGVDGAVPFLGGTAKVGAHMERRTSSYGIRYFRGTPDYIGGIPTAMTQLPLESIYAPENFGPGKFLFGEISQPTDNYDGEQWLTAGFLMMDVPLEIAALQFRIVGGARLESFRQDVTIPRPGTPEAPNRLDVTDVLPSLNLTWKMTDALNLRLAYAHSVNRPDFRERAATVYEDFLLNELVAGNPDLARAYARNYDARLEYFPGPGEVIAVSYFTKVITGAIEEQLLFSGTRTRVYFNSERAKNSGWEIELRTSLRALGGYWSNVSIGGNYTRIDSRVDFLQTVGNSSDTRFLAATRPMQGQSPSLINLALYVTDPSLGTSVSLLYNRVGRRLQTVGFLASDIYEEPRDLVDVTLTQPLAAGWDAKVSVRNLTAKDRVLTRDGLEYDRTASGRTVAVQMTYAF
jgi:outer membrane receptor protein involved in Fe transport